MKPTDIFPVPQCVDRKGGVVQLGSVGQPVGVTPEIAADSAVCEHIGHLLKGKLGSPVVKDELPVQLRLDNSDVTFAQRNREQAYRLTVADGRVTLTASGPQGLVWGAVTLAKLLEVRDGIVFAPECEIRDWPDLKWRGLFAESRWGQDLMTLDDWKAAIDTLVGLKFNLLTIGVYNCWPIQYHGTPSEFFYIPIRAFPQLKSPQHIEYYSALNDRDVVLDYIPLLFQEDFFGEIVAYGASRGMLIGPHFNTPGHNSLIPRLMPEISALDEQGNPTGYGFCLTNPRTYEVMYTIVDEICQRYLLPNGSDYYHIAGDEVYPLVGFHPDKPYETVHPWCRCENCRQHEEGELYLEYIIKLARRLKENGINHISMWHDQLLRAEKMGLDLPERLEREGLKDIIILNWWRYGGFYETTKPEMGLRRFVVPMTGYYYQCSYQGHLENIFAAERVGVAEDAEGTQSYGVWDPAFDRHFCALSEYSWNNAGGGTLDDFRRKYARRLFGDNAGRAMEGWERFQSVVDGHGARVAYSIWRYSHGYGQSEEQATARDNYPQYDLDKILADPEETRLKELREVVEQVQQARDAMSEGTWQDEHLRDIYLIECDRIIATCRAFVGCAEAVRAHRQAEGKPAGSTVEQMRDMAAEISRHLEALDRLGRDIERKREHFQVPHMLRELTFIREFVRRLRDELKETAESGAKNPAQPLAPLACMKVTPVPWVG